MTTTKALADALRDCRDDTQAQIDLHIQQYGANYRKQQLEALRKALAAADEALAQFDAQAAEQAAGGGEAVAADDNYFRYDLMTGRDLEAGKTHPAPAAPSDPQPKGAAVPQGPRTEFVLNRLRSALSAMTTFFGMDEDEASKPTLDKARQALDYAEIVMRPLEPWERQSLEDFRACVRRWHEKAFAKGYDGVESMCDTALPYGTRDLRLVSASTAPAESPAAPVQPVGERSPSTISLEDGAQLVLDGSHWSFRRSGSHIRFLNKFESQFVRAALAARGEKR